MTIGTAFMASADEAVTGTGSSAGRKHENIRALFPINETSFQVAALRNSGLRSLADLDGKKVGVGPARGPAKDFSAPPPSRRYQARDRQRRSGGVSRQVLNGEIDALGRRSGTDPLARRRSQSGGRDRVRAFRYGSHGRTCQRPALSPTTIRPGPNGQTAEIKSFSAWNFVVANKELPEETAYAITKAVLTAADPKSQIYRLPQAHERPTSE